jgi:hypothetical protein
MVQSVPLEFLLAPGAGEKAALIMVRFFFDHIGAGERRWHEPQRALQ